MFMLGANFHANAPSFEPWIEAKLGRELDDGSWIMLLS
jgi:hypothetical protein